MNKTVLDLDADRFRVSSRPRLAAIEDFPNTGTHDYENGLKPMQTRLQAIQQAYRSTGEWAVIVFEGWDAAGKGGVIRRLGWTLDPRSFKVHPISAPTEEERAHHYLERFWRKLPQKGQIVVFDRSWYGRVLVERVEGFATPGEWKRAYKEINEFEETLTAAGIRIAKVFLHITPDEQLRRFKERLTNPLKRWKLSYEDLRDHERWSDYELAIEDMMEKTSTARAPWYLIPANDKNFSRLASFGVLIERMGEGVSLDPPPVDPKIAKAAAKLLGSS